MITVIIPLFSSLSSIKFNQEIQYDIKDQILIVPNNQNNRKSIEVTSKSVQTLSNPVNFQRNSSIIDQPQEKNPQFHT